MPTRSAGSAGETYRPLVAVLGARGFVGSAVVRELARRPIRLRAVARRPGPVPGGAGAAARITADVRAEVEVRAADLTVASELARVVADADAVVHLVIHNPSVTSWRVPQDDPLAERVNVGVMRELVEVLRSGRRGRRPPPVVAFAGSVTQVGDGAGGRTDGTEPDRPATAYDRQKVAAEQVLKAATAEGVLCGVSLRLATVFGALPAPAPVGRGVVSTMIRRALAGEPLTMWHDGSVRRDLVHLDDVARAFGAALDHADRLRGRHWVVGTGRPVRVGDLFAAIADAVAAHTGRPPVPVVRVRPPEHAYGSDFASLTADSSAFTAVTGWRPRTGLADGLREAVAVLAGPATRGSASGQLTWTSGT